MALNSRPCPTVELGLESSPPSDWSMWRGVCVVCPRRGVRLVAWTLGGCRREFIYIQRKNKSTGIGARSGRDVDAQSVTSDDLRAAQIRSDFEGDHHILDSDTYQRCPVCLIQRPFARVRVRTVCSLYNLPVCRNCDPVLHRDPRYYSGVHAANQRFSSPSSSASNLQRYDEQ